MNQDHQKQSDDLLKVLQISRSMVAAADLDSLLKLIIDRSMELLDAERASLFLYDAGTDELITRIAAGVDEIRIPADKGIAGATVRTGSTINVPDAYRDERFNPEVDRQTGFHTRNILSVALRDHEGGLVGVLQVINKRRGAFDDYDVTLAETLGAQAGVAVQRASLIQHYVEKQRMQRAMQIAREIQQSLLPQDPPNAEGFDIAGFSKPADETGGDAYDFMPLPDNRWLLTVADATGHGIGPALVIAETRAMLRAVSLQGANVSHILNTVNNLLTNDLSQSRFVTCFFGLLDTRAARLEYVSAGHGPLIFYSREEDSFRQENATGLPLGIMEQADYGQAECFSFEPGDFAVITTDGFFEAVKPDGEMFGVARMLDLLRRGRDLTAAESITNLYQAVLEFTDGRPQADDLTAIVIRKTG